MSPNWGFLNSNLEALVSRQLGLQQPPSWTCLCELILTLNKIENQNRVVELNRHHLHIQQSPLQILSMLFSLILILPTSPLLSNYLMEVTCVKHLTCLPMYIHGRKQWPYKPSNLQGMRQKEFVVQ